MGGRPNDCRTSPRPLGLALPPPAAGGGPARIAMVVPRAPPPITLPAPHVPARSGRNPVAATRACAAHGSRARVRHAWLRHRRAHWCAPVQIVPAHRSVSPAAIGAVKCAIPSLRTVAHCLASKRLQDPRRHGSHRSTGFQLAQTSSTINQQLHDLRRRIKVGPVVEQRLHAIGNFPARRFEHSSCPSKPRGGPLMLQCSPWPSRGPSGRPQRPRVCRKSR